MFSHGSKSLTVFSFLRVLWAAQFLEITKLGAQPRPELFRALRFRKAST